MGEAMITASVHSLIGLDKPQRKVASRLRLRRCSSTSSLASSTRIADFKTEYTDDSSEDEGIPITREIHVQFEEPIQEFVPVPESVPVLLRMRMWMFQHKRDRDRHRQQESRSSQSGDRLMFAPSADQCREEQVLGTINQTEMAQYQTRRAQPMEDAPQVRPRHVVEETVPPVSFEPQDFPRNHSPSGVTVWSESAQSTNANRVDRPPSSQPHSDQITSLKRTTPHLEDDSGLPDFKRDKLQQHVPSHQSEVPPPLLPPQFGSQKATANTGHPPHQSEAPPVSLPPQFDSRSATNSASHPEEGSTTSHRQALRDMTTRQLRFTAELQDRPQTTAAPEAESAVQTAAGLQKQLSSSPQLRGAALEQQTTAAGPVREGEYFSVSRPQTHLDQGRDDLFWCGIDDINPSPVRAKPPLTKKAVKKKKTVTKPQQPQEVLEVKTQKGDFHQEWRLSEHACDGNYRDKKVFNNEPISGANALSNLKVTDSDLKRVSHTPGGALNADQHTKVRTTHHYRNEIQTLGARVSGPAQLMQEDKEYRERKGTSRAALTKKERTKEKPSGSEGKAKSNPSLHPSTEDHSEGKTSWNPWTLSGPPLYVPPRVNSNKKLIRNAVGTVCLAGAANSDRRHEVIQELDKKGGNHLLILFKDNAGSIKFKALYNYYPEEDEARRIYGTGPKLVSSGMAARFYKYNSGKRGFEEVTTKTLSIRISGFTLKSSFQKK